MKASWAVALLCALAVAGCAQQPGPPPSGEPTATEGAPAEAPTDYRPNHWLLDAFHPPTVGVSNGAEPSILADHLGRALWIGDTTGAYISRDNGTHWEHVAPYVADFGAAFGDGVALAQDDTGRLYVGILNDNRVDVVASDDLGSSWATMGIAAGVSGVADRPWLAADGDGEVVLFYFDAPLVAVGLWEHCARSTDGGQTFVDREPVSITPGQGGKAFFDSKGRFYFASNSGSLYRYDTTCLGTVTAIDMLSDTGGPNQLIQGAADGTDLYMAATDSGGDVVLAGSRDGTGRVREVTVSPDFLATNTFSTVAARDGLVAVAWYGSETGGDPSAIGFDGAFNVYVALVRDFWGDTSVEYYRLTKAPNHVGDICMAGVGCSTGSGDRDLLDYFMVDLDVWGGIHVAYGNDGASSNRAVAYARIPPDVAGVSLEVPADVLELAEELPPEPAADGVSPAASFTVKSQGYTLQGDATRSEDPQGSALTYSWSWGDGSTTSGVRSNHTYTRPGAFTITLKVTDPDGHVGQASRNVLVDGNGNSPPTPKITMSPASPVAGQTITLKDASTDPDGKVVKRVWTIGTKQSQAASVNIVLPEGTHTVRLAVTDDDGHSASTSATIKVKPAPDLDGDGQPDIPATGGSPPIQVNIPAPALGVLALALIGVASMARLTRRP